ncbi:MAG: O-antigen ligase family protein [Gemmataceae bacterium]
MENNNTYKIVLIALLGLGGLSAFFLSRDKLRNGYLLFVCTLALGYRTHEVTKALRIIPAELILYLLPLLLLGGSQSRKDSPKLSLPTWILLMMPFWGWAWLAGWDRGFPWDQRLAEFRNFVLLIPLFLVTPVVLSRRGGWQSVMLCLYCVSIWIAGMGLLEYLFPGIAKALPGFIGNPEPIVADGFKRASFSFYGSPIAVFICVMALPLSLTVWRWRPTSGARGLILAGAGLQLAAIYISGYRSIWLLVAAQFAVFVIVRKQYSLGAVMVCLAIVAYGALPSATRDRINSLGRVLEGRPDDVDTSGKKRWSRALEALEFAFQEPAGNGWAASGWVHSDFIQVAANQGLIPGAIFLGAYLVTLWRLGRQARARFTRSELEALPLPLLLSFLAVGGILLYEGVEFLPQTVLPVWLIWALVDTWLRQASDSPRQEVPTSRRSRKIAPSTLLIRRA